MQSLRFFLKLNWHLGIDLNDNNNSLPNLHFRFSNFVLRDQKLKNDKWQCNQNFESDLSLLFLSLHHKSEASAIGLILVGLNAISISLPWPYISEMQHVNQSQVHWVPMGRFFCIKVIDNKVQKFGYNEQPVTMNSFLWIALPLVSGTQFLYSPSEGSHEIRNQSHHLRRTSYEHHWISHYSTLTAIMRFYFSGISLFILLA